MIARSPALDIVRHSIVNTGSSFLRNVLWTPGATCAICAGIPNTGYPTCYKCAALSSTAGVLDNVGFVTYAWDDHQTGHTMYVYKAQQPGLTSRELVRSLLAYAIVAHWTCIGARSGSQPDGWTFVPSLSKRPGPHPLGQLALPIMGAIPYVHVTAADNVQEPRSFRPENFSVRATPPSHVLLLEDSWVTGARTQSVSSSLRTAGAERVTALVIARWLSPVFAHTSTFMAGLTKPFDPDVCPYTGLHC